jgi:hypothetical protein
VNRRDRTSSETTCAALHERSIGGRSGPPRRLANPSADLSALGFRTTVLRLEVCERRVPRVLPVDVRRTGRRRDRGLPLTEFPCARCPTPTPVRSSSRSS